MDQERRRLWSALVSIVLAIVYFGLVELLLGQGHVSRDVLDGQPFWRLARFVVALALLAVVARDVVRGQRDWPVERLVALVAVVALLRQAYALWAFGLGSGLAAAAPLIGLTASLVGASIWVGRRG